MESDKQEYENKLVLSKITVNQQLTKAVGADGKVPENFRCNIC